MEITDKVTNSIHEAVDKPANATSQPPEALGEKDKQLKHVEQQLMKNYRSYVRYNPWVSQ